jgi:hypothetical protein
MNLKGVVEKNKSFQAQPVVTEKCSLYREKNGINLFFLRSEKTKKLRTLLGTFEKVPQKCNKKW